MTNSNSNNSIACNRTDISHDIMNRNKTNNNDDNNNNNNTKKLAITIIIK